MKRRMVQEGRRNGGSIRLAIPKKSGEAISQVKEVLRTAGLLRSISLTCASARLSAAGR